MIFWLMLKCWEVTRTILVLVLLIYGYTHGQE